MKKKEVLFIINPVSGVKQSLKSELPQIIQQNINNEAYNWQVKISKSIDDVYDLSYNAQKSGIDLIVAVGGDGTINQVAKALVHSNSVLAIMPMGSGNGLAHHLKIPLDVISCLNIINNYNIRKIDSVKINNNFFFSVAGIGFDAWVAQKFSEASKRGFFSYLSIISVEYPKYKSKKYTLEIDGSTTIKRKAKMITFANSDQFGYNTSISPEASIDDGLIDICIVKDLPLIKLPIIMGMLITNNIHHSKYVEIIRCRKVRVINFSDIVVNVDGESFKIENDLSIEVIRQSLNVLA